MLTAPLPRANRSVPVVQSPHERQTAPEGMDSNLFDAIIRDIANDDSRQLSCLEIDVVDTDAVAHYAPALRKALETFEIQFFERPQKNSLDAVILDLFIIGELICIDELDVEAPQHFELDVEISKQMPI